MSSPNIVIRIDRKALLYSTAVILVATAGPRLWAEVVTLATTYPSPSGIYNQLVTTGNSGTVPADTTLNRNAGNTILVPPTNLGGNVGIGTLAPASKLQVAGGVQLGNDNSACTAAKNGTLRWWGGKLEGCAGGSWKAYKTEGPAGNRFIVGSQNKTAGVMYMNTAAVPIQVTISIHCVITVGPRGPVLQPCATLTVGIFEAWNMSTYGSSEVFFGSVSQIVYPGERYRLSTFSSTVHRWAEYTLP